MNREYTDWPDELPAVPKKRLHFDPTINAGHILTMAMMAVAVFGAWTTMDTRVVKLEEAKAYQTKRDDEVKAYQAKRDDSQDTAIIEKFGDIKDSIREVKAGVEELRRGQAGQRTNK